MMARGRQYYSCITHINTYIHFYRHRRKFYTFLSWVKNVIKNLLVYIKVVSLIYYILYLNSNYIFEKMGQNEFNDF